MSRATIHSSADTIKTLCGRKAEGLFWMPTGDNDAVTCKNCKRIAAYHPDTTGHPETPAVERDSAACPCGETFNNVVELQAHGTRKHGADFDYRDRELRTPAEPTTGPRWERIERLARSRSYAHLATAEVGGPELHRLDLLTSIIEEAEKARAEVAEQARALGVSWTRIGQQVGTTKQAAQMRYGKRRGSNRTESADADQLTISDA